LEYTLPDGIDAEAATRWLAEHLRLEREALARADRTDADTFDRRLGAAGLAAELVRADGGLELVLDDRAAGGPPLRVAVPRAERVLVGDVPPGPVRDRLAPVVQNRAVLPLARVRSRLQPLRVLNADDKTVVRLVVEHAEVVRRGHAPVPLRPRLRLVPVRGYGKQLDRVARLLRDDLGLAPAAELRIDEATRLCGSAVALNGGARMRPNDRADGALAAVLLRLAGEIERHLPGTIADLDPEFLHDLRVAVRRSRSMLREIRGVLAEDERARYREELRWLQSVTGPVRDLDIHLEDLDAHEALLPPALRADVEPIRALLLERRASELRRLRRHLRSARMRSLLAEWKAFLEQTRAGAPGPKAERPISAVAGARISRVYVDMVKRGSVVVDDTPAEHLHDLRKRGKELRYLLESFGSLFAPDQVTPMVKALKALQDTLGRFQDRQVQADALQDLGPQLAARERGPAALMATGLIVERLTAQQAAARGEFAERFAAFARSGARTAFVKGAR
jgi:CHAD domain-containing protein